LQGQAQEVSNDFIMLGKSPFASEKYAEAAIATPNAHRKKEQRDPRKPDRRSAQLSLRVIAGSCFRPHYRSSLERERTGIGDCERQDSRLAWR
jgi:hypothetical protein